MITVQPINRDEWRAKPGVIYCAVEEWPHPADFEIRGMDFIKPLCKIHMENLADALKECMRRR